MTLGLMLTFLIFGPYILLLLEPTVFRTAGMYQETKQRSICAICAESSTSIRSRSFVHGGYGMYGIINVKVKVRSFHQEHPCIFLKNSILISEERKNAFKWYSFDSVLQAVHTNLTMLNIVEQP